MRKIFIPMNIQKFAEPGAEGGGGTDPAPGAGQTPQIDYEKLAPLLRKAY